MKSMISMIVTAGALAMAPAMAAQRAEGQPVLAYANQPTLGSAASRNQPSQSTQSPRNILELMADKLELSRQQKLQLQTLIERQQQLAATLHQNLELSDKEKSTQFQQIRQQIKEQFAAMLTPSQRREFAKMMRQ